MYFCWGAQVVFLMLFDFNDLMNLGWAGAYRIVMRALELMGGWGGCESGRLESIVAAVGGRA